MQHAEDIPVNYRIERDKENDMLFEFQNRI